MSYNFIKSFINISVVNAYLKKSTYYDEFQSKIGNIINPNIKRRKDICFSDKDCQILDNIIFLDHKQQFKYREPYKLGTYTEDDNGFYNEHTDIQGDMNHRKTSMIICLSKSTDYEGGIFNLLELDKNFKFDIGDAIFFDSNLLHNVSPITKGTRKVIISFLYNDETKLVEYYKPFMTRLENIISYTLLDDNNKIIENSNIAKEYYSNYTLYVYHPTGYDINKYKNISNIKLIKVDPTNNRNLWKFFPAVVSNGIEIVGDCNKLLKNNIDTFLLSDKNIMINDTEIICRNGYLERYLDIYIESIRSNTIIDDKKFIEILLTIYENKKLKNAL